MTGMARLSDRAQTVTQKVAEQAQTVKEVVKQVQQKTAQTAKEVKQAQQKTAKEVKQAQASKTSAKTTQSREELLAEKEAADAMLSLMFTPDLSGCDDGARGMPEDFKSKNYTYVNAQGKDKKETMSKLTCHALAESKDWKYWTFEKTNKYCTDTSCTGYCIRYKKKLDDQFAHANFEKDTTYETFKCSY